jgi:lipoprotein-anchoring transpeptidase ErfK/SrfK
MENDEIKTEGLQPEATKSPFDDNQPDNEGIIQLISLLKARLQGNKKLLLILKAVLITVSSILIPVLIVLFILYIVPSIQESSSGRKTEITNDSDLKKDAAYKKQIALMSKNIQQLSRKLNTYTSGQSYIVINTTENKFYLYKNKKLIREGLCSSGANKILQTQKTTYVFKTPKGKFSITGKRKHPYWHRSDWDFIEQGLPVPPKDHPSRWEEGVLGDYALDLVDGYMIHGTIYKRLMGMPVTHGCVRLGDDDLEMVFNTLNIGSKVYIF